MSIADELFPVPAPSPQGAHDSLAVALRRALAVAVLVLFLLATIFILLSPAPERRGHARQLTAMFFEQQGIEIRADRDR